jgi:rubrerythrin
MQLESRRGPSGAPEPGEDVVFHSAGAAAQGEFRCVGCGYGVAVRTVLPQCPMCRGLAWEQTPEPRSFL